MNINIKTKKNFTTHLNRMKEKYGEEFEKLNGLHDKNLSFGDFIDGFVDEDTVADATIDGNANANSKDICSLEAEMDKPASKLLAFNKIFYEMNKKYGLQTAREWLETEWNGGFYLHDAPSATFKPYCFAYDLDQLAEKGLFFIQNNFNYQPPKHLTVYTDFVGEFVSWTSNRTSGKIACRFNSFPVIAGVAHCG